MSDDVYRTRSLGIAASGVRDQYADGLAAKLWELYIGDRSSRTKHYRDFLVGLLRKANCKNILDVACGTGIDSELLLEEGFQVTSVDASDKMLKYALKTRWNRRKEKAFDSWVIEEANWLTLPEDLKMPDQGFDAVVCMGNSFAHLPDTTLDNSAHRLALSNFNRFVKPGGLFIIDQRNYDSILDQKATPTSSIYYNSKYIKDIKTSILYVDGSPNIVTLDYFMDISNIPNHFDSTDSEHSLKGRLHDIGDARFRLSYYPLRLNVFQNLIKETFTPGSRLTTFGDFQPLGTLPNPGFYIHIVEKPKV